MSETPVGYVYLSAVKSRLLIPNTDTSFDAPLTIAANEATVLIDNILLYYTARLLDTDENNPIFWKARVVKLDSAGYTPCISSDIGKYVTDDTVEIGVLLTYDNTLRLWWIVTTSTIADNSVMGITGGTGAGTADGVSYMDIPDIISVIAADFCASIFKRRMLPDEVKIRGEFLPMESQDAVLDSQGWYAIAWKKLQIFIKSVYVKPRFKLIQSDPLSKWGYKTV